MVGSKNIKQTTKAPLGKLTYHQPRNPLGPFVVCDNPWYEYETRKQTLPPLTSTEYEKAIKQICLELGL